MNARNIINAFALVVAVASPIMLGGCTQRLIIEEEAPETVETNEVVPPSPSGHTEGAIANQALYVRSGETEPGETQSGPHPEPWRGRLGPHPEPWRRDTGDGNSPPPPPPNNDPDPDPNPKP